MLRLPRLAVPVKLLGQGTDASLQGFSGDGEWEGVKTAGFRINQIVPNT